MKISLEWLNTYLDRPVTADEVERQLTNVGFPVEDRQTFGSDLILDVEITSNRPDMLSHVGVAREVAAACGCGVKYPAHDLTDEAEESVQSFSHVVNEAVDLCPLYTARVIRGVKIRLSPAWLVRRLESIGQRSVNNVVDVTNFVLQELGQPLHAFDLNTLVEKRVVVRRARAGEPFEAIDGSQHQLQDDMLVIADADRPVAIAGVMGGLETEVCDGTVDVLLEAAQFHPISVRQTSRTRKLFSESSFRFERGVDRDGVDVASRRAASLIVELAGGQVARGVIHTGVDSPPLRTVGMRVLRCNQIIGLQVSTQQMREYLDRLGLAPMLSEDSSEVICTIPSYRLDLHREIDLIEEVVRLHGFEQIQVNDRIRIVARRPQPAVEAKQLIGDVLTGHGYHEAITFSTIATNRGKAFVPDGAEPLMIADPRRQGQTMLRPSLLPSLMTCRKSNQDVGNSDLRLYEIASVWWRRGGDLVAQEELALICDSDDPHVAVRDMRGTIEELFERVAGWKPCFVPIKDRRLTSVSAVMQGGAGGHRIGINGVLGSKLQDQFELRRPIMVSQIALETLILAYPPRRQIKPLGRFPGIERDLSLVVDEDVNWEIIEQCLQQAPSIQQIEFLGAYRGKQIPQGRKSVSVRVCFRDPNRTLRHEEVDPLVGAMVERLSREVGADLRGTTAETTG